MAIPAAWAVVIKQIPNVPTNTATNADAVAVAVAVKSYLTMSKKPAPKSGQALDPKTNSTLQARIAKDRSNHFRNCHGEADSLEHCHPNSVTRIPITVIPVEYRHTATAGTRIC
jgi:hypothetical protein